MTASRKPISGFIASVLNLILVIIVVNGIVVYAQLRDEGKDANITTIVVTQIKNIWTDAKDAWKSEPE